MLKLTQIKDNHFKESQIMLMTQMLNN